MKLVVVAAVFVVAIVALVTIAYSSSLPVINLDDLRSGDYPSGNMEMRAIVTKIESYSPLVFHVGNAKDDDAPRRKG